MLKDQWLSHAAILTLRQAQDRTCEESLSKKDKIFRSEYPILKRYIPTIKPKSRWCHQGNNKTKAGWPFYNKFDIYNFCLADLLSEISTFLSIRGKSE
jgi:hypothetical protein